MLKDQLAMLLVGLWWGSLTALILWVVPLLFVHLPTPAMAGSMAARLFSAQTWVALGCGASLLVILRSKSTQASVKWSNIATVLIVFAMLLALLLEFAVAPRIVSRVNLRLWHGLGSAMMVLECLCTGALVWVLAAQGRRQGGGQDVDH